MRIVTKVNLTLLVAVAAAVLLNFAAMRATVMPSFEALERAGADRNEARALEALSTLERQIAGTARDYAVWDETFAFLEGRQPDYPLKNMTSVAMRALDLDFVAIVDASGRVLLDRGFSGTSGEGLLSRYVTKPGDPLRALVQNGAARSGLMAAPAGLAAVAFAPVHDSAGRGVSPGIILFGRMVNVSQLREATQVEIHIRPVPAGEGPVPHYVVVDDAIETNEIVKGLDGRALSLLVTRTPSHIVALGASAVRSATGLMLLSMLIVVACLGIALRLIAVRRIERIRAHLSGVTATGALDPMPLDRGRDELSETTIAFNAMALQLTQLRGELRRRDYRHGAADFAAGLLDNIRAASPVASIGWDRDALPPAGNHPEREFDRRGDASLEAERAAQLRALIVQSAGESLLAGPERTADLRVVQEIVRHVEGILRDEDRASEAAGGPEIVRIDDAVARALRRIHRLGLSAAADLAPGAAIRGRRVLLDRILDTLLVEATRALQATGRASGRILVTARVDASGTAPTVEIVVSRTGSDFEAAERQANAADDRADLAWCAEAVRTMGGSLSTTEAGGAVRLTLPAVTLGRLSAA